MAKKFKEEWKTYGNVFDQFTKRNLFKLSSQGHFKELESAISIGKEANIFTAATEDDYVIVKIYRIEVCDFNQLYSYIRYDPRYESLKKQKRQILFAWTQREFRNLQKSREAGVSVPKPITFMNNILVEELIGYDRVATRLKESDIDDYSNFLDSVIKNYALLYKVAGLVHGDLSEYNILVRDQEPVFIDFSQASPTNSPNAKELLDRDVKNLVRFFSKKKVEVDFETLKKAIVE